VTRVTGPGVAQLHLLSLKLKAANPVLRRQMRAHLRRAADPIADGVRRAALEIPSHHDGALRGEIAGAVVSRLRAPRHGASLDVAVLPSRMPPGKETLPAHFDSRRGWGHPVYGDGPRRGWTWVHQTGRPGWFESAAQAAHDDARAAFERAIDDLGRWV
jgi:hypothetical protein